MSLNLNSPHSTKSTSIDNGCNIMVNHIQGKVSAFYIETNYQNLTIYVIHNNLSDYSSQDCFSFRSSEPGFEFPDFIEPSFVADRPASITT